MVLMNFVGVGTRSFPFGFGWVLHLDFNNFRGRLLDRPLLPRYGAEILDYLFIGFVLHLSYGLSTSSAKAFLWLVSRVSDRFLSPRCIGFSKHSDRHHHDSIVPVPGFEWHAVARRAVLLLCHPRHT